MRKLMRNVVPHESRSVVDLPYPGFPDPINDPRISWRSFILNFPQDRIHAQVRDGEQQIFKLTDSLRAVALLPVTRCMADRRLDRTAWAPFLIDCGSPATVFMSETEPVREGEQQIFKLTDALRAVALLPVEDRYAVRTVWVPFLIDSGSLVTCFTNETIKVLNLATADKLGELVSVNKSKDHFYGVNVLGTDALRNATLHIQYAQNKVSIEGISIPALPPLSSVWVKYGTAVFEVTPSKNVVDSLKVAVKVKALCALAGRDAFTLIVKDDKGNVLKASAPLQANTEETAYIVE